MERHVIKLANREFPLAFSLATMIRMQEEMPDYDFSDLVEIVSKPKGLIDTMYELAVSGAAQEGRKLDVSKEWMAEHIPVHLKSIQKITIEVSHAIADGMRMETEEKDQADREVDVVLEEIKKKEEKTD